MRNNRIFICLLLFSATLLINCVSFRKYNTKYFIPVYMSHQQFRSSFKVLKPQPLRHPGKIYLKDNFIFISDTKKGIHVIDNSNPRKPKKVAFLKIFGNQDLAIKGNILYADSIVDLLAIDISSLKTAPSKIKIVKRVKDIFPYDPYRYMGIQRLRRFGFRRWRWRIRDRHYFEAIDRKKGIVVDWKITDKPRARARLYCCMPGAAMGGGIKRAGSRGGDSGVGGSLARFLVYKDLLYTIDSRRLKVFNVTNPSKPRYLSSTKIGMDIETIFYYGNKLFIGAESGLYIYDISQVPEKPKKMAMMPHARMRDPVVVQGNYAWVTLREPGGLLNLYDIRNPGKPRLLRMFRMRRPYGLGISGKFLFVCIHGGVVVLDADKLIKSKNFRWRMAVNNFIFSWIKLPTQGFDVIPLGKTLFVISESGFYQYDYSNIKKISLISSILIERDK